jgi:hypothetical protein
VDVVIVKHAVEMASSFDNVLVVTDDTNVLVLLLYHATGDCTFYMETKETISINVAIAILDRELCICLPFVHAMYMAVIQLLRLTASGKPNILIFCSHHRNGDLMLFGDSSASLQEVTDVGELFIQSLCSGGFTLSRGNDHHRHLQKFATKYIPAKRLPPTSRACYLHCLRVHHQVNTWIQLKTTLNKEHYVFRVQGGHIFPIFTDMEAAPPSCCS